MSDSLESCGSGYDINQPYEWNYEMCRRFVGLMFAIAGEMDVLWSARVFTLSDGGGPLLNGR